MNAATVGERTDTETLARLAMAEGQAALSARDTETARRWFDRAHRLVPADPNVALGLASTLIGDEPDRAAALFHRIARAHDLGQAWLGLAACRFRLDDWAGAMAALEKRLSDHALSADSLDLIGRIAARTGWCGLHSDGRLEIHPLPDGRGKVQVLLDGRSVRGRRLPRGWALASRVDVRVGDVPLPGSPIRIEVIRHVTGCVEAVDGGIAGWAWHPNDPETDPELTLVWPDLGQDRRIVTLERGRHFPNTGPLAQPRGFTVARSELPAQGGLVHVRGPNGRDLLGSPLDPLAGEKANAAAAIALGRAYAANQAPLGFGMLADAPVPGAPIGADGRMRAVTVVMPVHDGGSVVRDCLRSLLASIGEARVLVVDDGSRDPDLIAHLAALAKARRIQLLRHETAQGFPAAANAGMRAARGRDVVLLNSDTLVPPDWLGRLRAAAYAARDIGTVTPLSNDASILSYPDRAGRNPRPAQADVNRIDRLARRANPGLTIDIPVGVGFCLYIRRDCLNAAGLFRTDVFAQGYGEENDLCLRARHLGWRNVALPGLFVGHLGGASFGPAAVHLRARNGRILERLHPGHDAMIGAWAARDPLGPARRRIDLRRWSRPGRGESVILITHDDGGGVEARVAAAVTAHRQAGLRPVVLRPARTASGGPAIAVHDGIGDDFVNLVYAMPAEMDALLTLLRAGRPRSVEVHHLTDFGAAVYDLLTRLALPRDVFVHDYAWFCPRVSLVSRDHYCGEPDLAGCSACIADNGHFLSEDIPIAALRQRSAAFLTSARSVVVPCDDVGTRLRRHFPVLTPRTVPHEDDAAWPTVPPPRRDQGTMRVCVAGGIGLHKGYDIILACARDAAARGLDLDFVIVGNTTDDIRLMATGRVFVTGRFKPEEATETIRRQKADLGFVPSVCPETWCLTLGDLWRAGLPACAFDFGAPAERIRRTGRGFVLPLGLPPAAINTAIMTAVGAAREKMRRTPVSGRTTRHVASGLTHDFAMHAEK
jgi:GT2 family glycosyltransferase